MEKKLLRQKLQKERQEIAAQDRIAWQNAIYDQLWALNQWEQANIVMTYLSFGDELDTWPLVEHRLRLNKTLCVPKVVDKKTLAAIEITSKQQLAPGIWGIAEPVSGREISPCDLDLIIVPALAFDLQGYRLGYGGGYYDRLLEKSSGFKVGLAFACFIRDIPVEPWDQPVDMIITEQGSYGKRK